jgi:hypothetical protein
LNNGEFTNNGWTWTLFLLCPYQQEMEEMHFVKSGTCTRFILALTQISRLC